MTPDLEAAGYATEKTRGPSITALPQGTSEEAHYAPPCKLRIAPCRTTTNRSYRRTAAKTGTYELTKPYCETAAKAGTHRLTKPRKKSRILKKKKTEKTPEKFETEKKRRLKRPGEKKQRPKKKEKPEKKRLIKKRSSKKEKT
ncbi:hypothetical protein GLOIN_2v1471321 [Rhizophagus irregularis DAOM 181602=DAOM 197198]|uniref:Uncharacterized protein n=1 Tax=Rhizophagus irregularis (strain DAOM 181602 / DAOM 197198 / MUCL 43194) TaxID=747089 RepID=A0A2P4QTA8_RHIID|nr:hypothetical protein GLOIN_2v1471321 [Rhizophagus irregularis DAOM 181602=DAOM 197198]PKY28494.1 hypothetical protein RhiirB3_391089 [Rhizophagus irregularis]POG80852.1 hypothetical protein GLOIN_2v1471321 [Rhizophagus irregularis DAOM 181602=DAOM 197198]|eukprot:XP_025187718.1 hypothetical protein GLOIN_2v1471321 [Rhizophagus irregularis DAOM 181602=DAOM 197198]